MSNLQTCISCGLTRNHNAPDECDACAGSLVASDRPVTHPIEAALAQLDFMHEASYDEGSTINGDKVLAVRDALAAWWTDNAELEASSIRMRRAHAEQLQRIAEGRQAAIDALDTAIDAFGRWRLGED